MRKQSQTEIFTIGHSNHSWPKFSSLLRVAEIEILIDVRTFPRSRFAHFGQPQLQKRLNGLGVAYLHLGKELGGRGLGGEPLDFETIGCDADYQGALAHVIEIAGAQRAALMCSEHEPLDCHRFFLLATHLVRKQILVRHILRCGRIEDHAQTESRRSERGAQKAGTPKARIKPC